MKRALHLAGQAFVYLMYVWVAFSVIVCGLTIISLGHHLATKEPSKSSTVCTRQQTIKTRSVPPSDSD